jgi:uncharacterized alpha-E superfamily protein
MLSRVADSIYWLSRYVERAENLARMVGVGYESELDAGSLVLSGEEPHFEGPLFGVLAVLGCREEFRSRERPTDREMLLRFLTFDRRNLQSIFTMISVARENARATQQLVGAEVWSQLNRLYLSLKGPRARRRFQRSPSRFYAQVQRGCMLWNGVIDNTQPRDEVYSFLELGRYLERVDLACRILLAHAPLLVEGEGESRRASQILHCTRLLRSCAAHESFLRMNNDRIDSETVVRFLVLDGEFPRAIRFGVARCRRALQHIAGAVEGDYASEAERLLGRLDGELRYIEVAEILDRGLATYIGGLQSVCHKIGHELHRAYFAA